MYLILYDADDNATLEVFHDGVDVIGLRAVREEKGRRKRSDGEDHPSEKIRPRRSTGGLFGEDPTEKIRRRRFVREGLMEKIQRRRPTGEEGSLQNQPWL